MMKFISPILFATLFGGALATLDYSYDCQDKDLGLLDAHMIEKVGKKLIDRTDDPFPFGEVFFTDEEGVEPVDGHPAKLVANFYVEFHEDKLQDTSRQDTEGNPLLELVGGFQQVFVNVPDLDEDCGAKGTPIDERFFESENLKIRYFNYAKFHSPIDESSCFPSTKQGRVTRINVALNDPLGAKLPVSTNAPTNAPTNFATSPACWTYMEGYFHGGTHQTCSSQTYDDVVQAQAACVANLGCFGIAKQSNLCDGKYRINIPEDQDFEFFADWKKYDLWSYKLDDRTGNSCTVPVPTGFPTGVPAPAPAPVPVPTPVSEVPSDVPSDLQSEAPSEVGPQGVCYSGSCLTHSSVNACSQGGCFWYPYLSGGMCSSCAGVNCGGHRAPHCKDCPDYNNSWKGKGYCNGECKFVGSYWSGYCELPKPPPVIVPVPLGAPLKAPLLQLNGAQIDFDSSFDPPIGSLATELTLTDNSHADIDASTIGNFGSSDFSIEFTFSSTGGDITPDGTWGTLFMRSDQSVSPYTGPSAFLYNNGKIEYFMHDDDKMTCHVALPSWRELAYIRKLKFERNDSTLSLTIFTIDGDEVKKCTKEMDPEKTIDVSQFVNAPLRFGAVDSDHDDGNLRAQLSNIKLETENETGAETETRRLNVAATNPIYQDGKIDFCYRVGYTVGTGADKEVVSFRDTKVRGTVTAEGFFGAFDKQVQIIGPDATDLKTTVETKIQVEVALCNKQNQWTDNAQKKQYQIGQNYRLCVKSSDEKYVVEKFKDVSCGSRQLVSDGEAVDSLSELFDGKLITLNSIAVKSVITATIIEEGAVAGNIVCKGTVTLKKKDGTGAERNLQEIASGLDLSGFEADDELVATPFDVKLNLVTPKVNLNNLVESSAPLPSSITTTTAVAVIVFVVALFW